MSASIAADVLDVNWRLLRGKEKSPDRRGFRFLRRNKGRGDRCHRHAELQKQNGQPKHEGSRAPVLEHTVSSEEQLDDPVSGYDELPPSRPLYIREGQRHRRRRRKEEHKAETASFLEEEA